MISFRQHVVTLVAVFLALAVGIVLGGGLLDGSGTRTDAADGSDGSGTSGTSAPSTAGGSADPSGGASGAATGEGAATYAEKLAVAAGPQLYAGGLAASPVALLVMPGADKDVVKALSTQVQAAGGRVTGRFVVRDPLLDPGQRSLVDTLGSQLVTQLADPRLTATAPTYERIGQVLGAAVATRQAAAVPADQVALSARESLAGVDLVSPPSVPVAAAPLVLVVLGPEQDADQAAVEIQTAVVQGLTATAVGVVVTGDEASAASGTLAGLRAAAAPGVLATVDGEDTELGPISAVLALVGAAAGRGGAFGPDSPDQAVPVG